MSEPPVSMEVESFNHRTASYSSTHKEIMISRMANSSMEQMETLLVLFFLSFFLNQVLLCHTSITMEVDDDEKKKQVLTEISKTP